MPTIQVSQIVLRSGPAIDLPGAPSSLSPLTFTDGLLPGELAFASDTGALFVGHDPDSGMPNYNRTTFPYRNIEVLTEASTTTLARLIGNAIKEQADDAYHEAELQNLAFDWNDVIVPREGDEDYVYRFEIAPFVAAIIDYACYTEDGTPVKIGQLLLRYIDGIPEPNVIDEASVARRMDLLAPEANQAEDIYTQVDFRFTVAGPIEAQYLAFQYKNHTNGVVDLRFKVSRPKV